MPLSYLSGTLAEHRACRTDAVVFDVSHLGTLRVTGDGAYDRLQQAFTNDLARIGPGRTQYTHLLDEDGSVLDDIIVWWTDEDSFDVMPNASNTDRVRDAPGRLWCRRWPSGCRCDQQPGCSGCAGSRGPQPAGRSVARRFGGGPQLRCPGGVGGHPR